MNKTDFHIHADFSADSKIKLSALVPKAIELGYTTIAITEHLDLLPEELAIFGSPQLDKYKASIDFSRKTYPQLKLLFGIEVGDFHRVKAEADAVLSNYKFDLVLGSVHIISDHVNVAIPLKQHLSKAQILDYYEQNLNLVENCDIDVLAHLGVFKRYYTATPDESHCHSLISKIFEVMIKKEIALEINFSAFRRTYQHLHPETEQLALYKKLGGRLVTIGSDSHKLDQVDDFYAKAQKAITNFGFEHLQIN